eukprot:2964329-Amphidinium_carterae.1
MIFVSTVNDKAAIAATKQLTDAKLIKAYPTLHLRQVGVAHIKAHVWDPRHLVDPCTQVLLHHAKDYAPSDG